MLEWNYNDDVRNISTLGDIFKYITIYPNLASKTQFFFIKQKIFNILNNIQKYSSQSLSFLGVIVGIFNINKEAYCKKLLTDLPAAEEEFEKHSDTTPKKMSTGLILMGVGAFFLTWGAVNFFKSRR
jgi:hypothetical protein